jgi:thiol-disulfide isomerase/thioredoxin
MKKTIFSIFVLMFLSFTLRGQDLSFQTLDKSVISLQSHRGKVVVLAVGASWLPLSKQQVSVTNKLAKQYASRKDIVIYFVFTDSNNPKSKNFASDEQLMKFAQENKISVGILRDPDALLSTKKLKVEQLPSFVVIGKNGVLADTFSSLDLEATNLDNLTAQISSTIEQLL